MEIQLLFFYSSLTQNQQTVKSRCSTTSQRQIRQKFPDVASFHDDLQYIEKAAAGIVKISFKLSFSLFLSLFSFFLTILFLCFSSYIFFLVHFVVIRHTLYTDFQSLWMFDCIFKHSWSFSYLYYLHTDKFSKLKAIQLINYEKQVYVDNKLNLLKTVWFCSITYFPVTPAQIYSELVLSGSINIWLKTHIRDKRVCGMETSQCISNPQIILLRYIAECGLSGSNGSNGSNGLSDLPWTPSMSTCLLSPLYSHSVKRCIEWTWGSHHWNASLRAADLLMTIVSL